MKKLIIAFKEKSVKQKIAIIVVAVAMLTLLFFTIKANFFDVPAEADGADSKPQFRIGISDTIMLLAVVVVYGIHKFREKRKQRRM